MPPATKDQLFLTALPNGENADKTKLRLSLFLTPSLNKSDSLPDLFASWPDTAKNLKWIVTFNNTSHLPIGASVKADIDPLSTKQDGKPEYNTTLWREIFAGVEVRQRTATNHLHRTWRLSHNITMLHKRHSIYRLAHAYSQFASSRKINLGTDITGLRDDTSPPPLFLHPEFQTDLALKYDDRKLADTRLAALVAALSAPVPIVVQKRVSYGITQLERYGGAPLSAASLCALYISCLKSAGQAGRPDAGAIAAIKTIRSWFPPNPPVFQSTYPDLDTILEYVQMLLFHRRNSPVAKCKIDPPDFHQLLGMVQNYPAIMRPLGLVYDLVVSPPASLPAQCSVLIQLDPNDTSSVQFGGQVDVLSVYTQCTVQGGDFFATSRDANLIQGGVLNLQIPGVSSAKRFMLVPENADGQAVKLTDQFNNAARATEYDTNAPTAMNPPALLPAGGTTTSTPSAAPDPSSAPPAPRTVGLALFDQDRLTKLEQSAASVPDTPAGQPPVPPSDFYAEDLILGYRVDVFYKQKFYSLCQRQSKYNIFTPRTASQVDTWLPTTPMELSADEGFISFGTTQSPVDPNAPSDTSDPAGSRNSQTQIHQAVFTWTGWSLSVSQPNFPAMNKPQEPACDPASNSHLAIQPCYQLPDGSKLPPLRFNTDYQVRCRVVDLAGNGALPGIDPNNTQYGTLTIAPETQFSLHEPIRAPHFLLLHPIDRSREPGTHIDRLVARDGGDGSARMLVPPRESLRLAELWGILKNDRLPPTAFGNQQLLIDGTFPSVACAKHEGWIDGEINDPGDNDAIFLRKRDLGEVKNPYYPDPLANYVHVEVFRVLDDPTQSLSMNTVWIKIKKGTDWPDRSPVRVRLVPTDTGDPSAVAVSDALVEERIGLLTVPTLDVKLPKACTVVLKISSAACDCAAPQTSLPEFSVHLSHLSQLQMQNPDAVSALVSPQAGAKLHSLASSLKALPNNPLTSPNAFVDGSLDISTPSRTMTLVHAVKQPLEPPEFAPFGSASYLQIVRDFGKPQAQVSGALRAHWPSTAKITCYAEWCDQVDDVNKKEPIPVHHREVAFTVTAKDFVTDTPWPASRLRVLQKNILQHFLDTRAHDVKYTLVASTNFREYYLGADNPKTNPNDKQYQRDGSDSVNLTVASSVRPLAPSIAYVIPAFVWVNTYDRDKKIWYEGRTVILRVYLDRPFLLSGNRETIGVVLFDPISGVKPEKQNFVSRWGSDPARPITTPILQNELSEANLCEPGQTIESCVLAEGDHARIKPCTIHYSTERKLWYADIPIDTLRAYAPFVRLAFVRWQPDALNGAAEARCSQVVFAEFMQISPDRWVSIQKRSGSKYTIAISGAFPNDGSKNPLSLTLYQRWYALGRDTGWREIKCDVNFSYTPPDAGGVSTWSAELHTPHSAYLSKYRVLLREKEFPDQEARKSLLMFLDLP